MNSKVKFFLLSMLVVPAVLIFAEVEKFDDSAPVESTCETKSHKKTYDCLRVKRLLRVCGNEEVLGNLSVAGNTTLNNLAVNGDLSLTNSLVVNDINVTNATINNLTVTGSVVLPSPLTLGALIVESINLTATTSGQVGVPGIGGLLAYGQAIAISGGIVVSSNENVIFTTSGLTSPNVNYSTAGLEVTEDGVYSIDFQVRGQSALGEDITFGLYDGSAVIPNSQFYSSNISVDANTDVHVVIGSILVELTAGTIVSLRNLDAVNNVTLTPGSNGISASMIVKKIAA